MNRFETAVRLAKASLSAVNEEIKLHHEGASETGTLRQLQYIRSSCEEMILQIETGELRKTNFGISRMIVDSWPLCSHLGELLIKTEKAWNEISFN